MVVNYPKIKSSYSATFYKYANIFEKVNTNTKYNSQSNVTVRTKILDGTKKDMSKEIVLRKFRE